MDKMLSQFNLSIPLINQIQDKEMKIKLEYLQYVADEYENIEHTTPFVDNDSGVYYLLSRRSLPSYLANRSTLNRNDEDLDTNNRTTSSIHRLVNTPTMYDSTNQTPLRSSIPVRRTTSCEDCGCCSTSSSESLGRVDRRLRNVSMSARAGLSFACSPRISCRNREVSASPTLVGPCLPPDFRLTPPRSSESSTNNAPSAGDDIPCSSEFPSLPQSNFSAFSESPFALGQSPSFGHVPLRIPSGLPRQDNCPMNGTCVAVDHRSETCADRVSTPKSSNPHNHNSPDSCSQRRSSHHRPSQTRLSHHHSLRNRSPHLPSPSMSPSNNPSVHRAHVNSPHRSNPHLNFLHRIPLRFPLHRSSLHRSSLHYSPFRPRFPSPFLRYPSNSTSNHPNRLRRRPYIYNHLSSSTHNTSVSRSRSRSSSMEFESGTHNMLAGRYRNNRHPHTPEVDSNLLSHLLSSSHTSSYDSISFDSSPSYTPPQRPRHSAASNPISFDVLSHALSISCSSNRSLSKSCARPDTPRPPSAQLPTGEPHFHLSSGPQPTGEPHFHLSSGPQPNLLAGCASRESNASDSSDAYTSSSSESSMVLGDGGLPSALLATARSKGPSAAGDTGLGQRLLAATERGRALDVRRLLDQGADPNFRGTSKWTPLLLASFLGHEEIVSMLLEVFADIQARGPYGLSALHMAAYNAHGRCAALLLGGGAHVDARDRSGRTALHYAASYGHGAVARLLLQAGATKRLRNRFGLTPRDEAVSRRMARLVRP